MHTKRAHTWQFMLVTMNPTSMYYKTVDSMHAVDQLTSIVSVLKTLNDVAMGDTMVSMVAIYIQTNRAK